MVISLKWRHNGCDGGHRTHYNVTVIKRAMLSILVKPQSVKLELPFTSDIGIQGSTCSNFFACPATKSMHFFNLLILNADINCTNSLTRLVVLFAPSHQRVGYVQPREWPCMSVYHYSDDIMGMMAPQITSVSIVYSTVCSAAYQIKHQSSTSVAFVRGIHRWPVNSPHKGPVTRKMSPFDDFIMFVHIFICPLVGFHTFSAECINKQSLLIWTWPMRGVT